MDAKQFENIHKTLDIDIVKRLLEITPKNWHSIILEIEYQRDSHGDENYPMTISSFEGQSSLIIPSHELTNLIRKHSFLFQKHSTQWKYLKYEIHYDDEFKDWKYSIDYSY